MVPLLSYTKSLACQMNKIKFNSILVVAIVNLVIVIFWLVNRQFIPVHDFTLGARIFELDNTLKAGQFPPRWSQNFGFGYGMPLFQFYAPLAFYLAEAWHLLGFSILSSIKLSYLTATLIAFCGAYVLGKRLTNRFGGLLAATAFTLAPYHAVNLYVRGALAEYWAISFMPWIVYFSFCLFDNFKVKKSYLGLSLSLAGLFLSHNVTVLTFMPIWLILIFGLSLIKNNLQKLFLIFLSTLHALIISAFFLIPAFIQKSYTNVESLTAGFSQFKYHFLYLRQLFYPNWKYGGSIYGLADDMSFYLGNDILFLAALGILSAFYLFLKHKRVQYRTLVLTAAWLAFVLFLSLIATSFRSQFLWEKISLARFIQFPWRFLGVASLLLAMLAAYATIIPSLRRLWPVMLALIILFNGQFFRPAKLIEPGQLYQPTAQFISQEMSTVLPDYLPPDIDWKNFTPSDQPARLITAEGKLDILSNTAKELRINVLTDQDSIIVLNRFVFPNWRVEINGQVTNCDQIDYVYHCPLNQGKSQLRMFWQEKGINAASNRLSLVGLAALALPFIFLFP